MLCKAPRRRWRRRGVQGAPRCAPLRAKGNARASAPSSALRRRTRERHLQQRGGDAAVGDVVPRGDAAGVDLRLDDVPHGGQLGGRDVGGDVAYLPIHLPQRGAAQAAPAAAQVHVQQHACCLLGVHVCVAGAEEGG